KVMMTAQSGLDGKFASLRAQLEGNELPACGRQALAQPAVVVIPDPITFCANCPLAKNYLDRGAMTVRLASEGRIYGLLAVSLPADLAGDSEEQALLHEVASDIAFALQNIELEAARAQAEAALRESEEKFKHLFDHVPIGLSLTLPTGEVDANQAFYEMFGYAQDHAALKWQEVTHPEDVEKSQAVIDALMAGEEDSARFTKRYVHKDGSIVWAEVSTSIRRDAEDAVRYFMTAVQDITERKEAEHALRESEQRFRRIYENIAVGLAQISIDFVIESANKAYCRMLGYSEEELIGKHLREITHPDILEENLRKQALLAAGEIDHYRMEKQFVHKDGHIVYGVLDANLIRDAEDQPLYFIGGVLDITERKEAEERLKESERQYRTLVETISHGIAEVDLAGRMVFLNDAHQRMLGYQPGELVGDYFWEHDPTPGHTKEIRAYFEYLKNEQPDPEPYISQNVCKDGEVIDVLVDWNYKRDEDGVLQGFISVVTDITERKEAEEALRESERRFRIVLENLPGGLFAHDLDGHLLLVNEMSARNTGYSQEELLDMTVADIDPSSVTRDDRAHLWHQLDEGETITLHSTHVRKDGSKYPVEVYLSNITLKGEPIILGVAMDITQRKQAEEALRESEERFRDVFETSPIGIAMVDTATQLFLDANDGLLRILGYSLDELKQLTVMDVTHLEDWAREAEMVRAYLEGSASRYAVAKRFIRKDGEIRWVRITGAVMTGISDGETPVAIANVVDITQRKRAEEALRESERQKDLILNASAEMIAYYDTDLRVIWANRAAAESVDMSPGDLVDMHCYEIWHQRDEPCHECPVLKARDHKAPWQGEQETPDGRYWYTRGYPVFDEAGEVTALVEFGQDITDRKEAEQALRESEKKYRTLFESALNPIFMVDEHSQYIDANPAALAFLECDRETLLEKRVWDFSPPDLLEHQQQEHAPFVGRRTLETDYFVHGEIKTLLLNVVPLKLKGETVLYGVGQDITERKRVEEERARLTAQVREQAQQMEQILATVPTGVLLLDAEWRVLRANPTAKKDLVKLADI
ncbi:MAG: PAS domain S-box protein, partial [Chloroflexi bacterium]|nr:PAS domain S-box protein [Chloroflexota bacterium]